MKNYFTFIFIPFLAIFLVGCSSLNSQFDCSKKPGVLCHSLGQVNQMVDRGELGANSNQPQFSFPNNSLTPAAFVPPDQYSADPIRLSETVMRVWIAPYEDTQGNYYQPSIFYTVIKPGHWIGNPVKALSNEEDS